VDYSFPKRSIHHDGIASRIDCSATPMQDNKLLEKADDECSDEHLL